MVVRLPEFFDIRPGEALNIPPFEAEGLINFTGPIGSMSGLVIGIIFQLGKWGFERVKIEEWITVSPIFRAYYDITLQQKLALEGQIKTGLAHIATAIHDYELVFHDLRKYREFLDHFTKIEKGKELVKKRKREEGERLIKEGEQTLKAIFIDEVDVHTGEGIALKLIAPRWPTIIADFMRLADEDVEPEKIAKKLRVSEAEGVVLATKNKLYVEWRDRLFRPTVIERYQRLSRLAEARRTSITEYTNMLRPAITRFKMITDALESTAMARGLHIHPLHRPDAQAFSIDFMRMWAWRPFAPSEKYKITRESLDEIPIAKAGFSREEIKLLTEKFKKKGEIGSLTMDEELLVDKGRVYGLPVEPSIDNIVREYKSAVEKEYGVKIDIFDLFEARRRLAEQFSRRAAEAAETALEATATGKGVVPGAAWVFSPYFVFLDIPLQRSVIRLPDGKELEDLWIENLRTATKTQNVILIHLMEVIAKEKLLHEYVRRMLGEVGGVDLKTIEELAREEFPEIYGKPEIVKRPEPKDITAVFKKIKNMFGDILRSFGLTGDFVAFLRARGPYEFAMDDRITEIIQPEPGGLYQLVISYMQQAMGVPGIRW